MSGLQRFQELDQLDFKLLKHKQPHRRAELAALEHERDVLWKQLLYIAKIEQREIRGVKREGVTPKKERRINEETGEIYETITGVEPYEWPETVRKKYEDFCERLGIWPIPVISQSLDDWGE